MQHIVYRPAFDVKAITTGYTCNCCGKHEDRGEDPYSVDENFHHFSFEGGYYSKYPGDMNRVSFDLCGACLKAFVESFKVPAEHIWLMGSTYEDAPILVKHSETLETYYWFSNNNVIGKDPDGKDLSWDGDDLEGAPKKGIYRHSKGKLYDVLGAVWIQDPGEWGVLYRALYEDSQVWVRPLEMFLIPGRFTCLEDSV